jgi:hypothetical protein
VRNNFVSVENSANYVEAKTDSVETNAVYVKTGVVSVEANADSGLAIDFR